MTDEKKEKKGQYHEAYARKAFLINFGTIAIFGIPAFSGLFLGLYLEKQYAVSRLVTIAILCGTFLFSWTILFIVYRTLQKELQSLE